MRGIENEGQGSFLGSFDGVPGLLAEGTCVLLLSRPPAYAVSVVCVVAGPPADEAGFTIADLIGLALEAGFVDAVLADGTVLDSHVPTPQCHRVPLLYLDTTVHLHLITI